MNVGGCHVLGNTTLQPLSLDLWQYSGLEISPRLHSQWKRNAQELASHIEAHLIGQNRVPTKSDTQNGRPIKREYHILPTTQIKGACLGMKPSHKSLPDPMPHGEQGNPQEVLKSLLSQKRGVSQVVPRSEH